MKEFINFYYGIVVEEVKNNGDYFFFYYLNELYYLVPFNDNQNILNKYIEISNRLLKYHLKSHLFIQNKHQELITSIDDVNYVLLKIVSNNNEINIFELRENQKKFLNENIIKNNKYVSWSYLWETKIDYIENALREVKKDNIIEYSVDYYLGLGENSIFFYNKTMEIYYDSKYPLTWCHRRVYYPNMTINYLNPINYLYDYDVRDIAEYIKSVFFVDTQLAYEELLSYLKIEKFSSFRANLFFARLLYPSYYFDIVEKWLNNKNDTKGIIKLVQKQKDFENLLKKAYQLLSENALMISMDNFK